MARRARALFAERHRSSTATCNGAVTPSTLRIRQRSGRFAGIEHRAHDTASGIAGLKRQHRRQPTTVAPFSFDSHGVVLDLRHALGETLALDNAKGQLRWHNARDGVRFDVDQTRVLERAMSPDRAKGAYSTSPTGQARSTGTRNSTRVDAPQLYLLRASRRRSPTSAQVAAEVGAGRQRQRCALKLVGALADFPFADAKRASSS